MLQIIANGAPGTVHMHYYAHKQRVAGQLVVPPHSILIATNEIHVYCEHQVTRLMC